MRETVLLFERSDLAQATAQKSYSTSLFLMIMPIRLNLSEALDNLGGDEKLLRELAQIFEEDSPTLVNTLCKNVQSQNDIEAARAAHSLKGLFGTFGAEPAITIAEQAEKEARLANWSHLQESTVPQLQNAVAAVIEALRSENVLPGERS